MYIWAPGDFGSQEQEGGGGQAQQSDSNSLRMSPRSAEELGVKRLELISRRDALRAMVANLVTSLGAFDVVAKPDAAMRGAVTFLLGLAVRRDEQQIGSGLGVAAALVLLEPVVAGYRQFRNGAAITSVMAFQHTLQLACVLTIGVIVWMGRRLEILNDLRRKQEADESRLKLL